MSKIAGIGIDIEELDRFDRILPHQSEIPDLAKMIFTEDEINHNRLILPYLTFPLAFSCKEAFFKAFGVSWTNSPISWKDIELIFEDPKNLQNNTIRLSGHARELFNRKNCSRYETSFEIREDHVVFEVVLIAE